MSNSEDFTLASGLTPSVKRGVFIGAGLIALLIGGNLWATLSDTAKPENKIATSDAASASVNHFFDTYFDSTTGRTIRKGNGNDTTAAGQSGAALLAVASGNKARFDQVKAWTFTNLVGANGLLASTWNQKPSSTQDVAATVQFARALAVAGDVWSDEIYKSQAKTTAQAIKNSGLVELGVGVDAKSFAPSSYLPRALRNLGTVSGSDAWNQVADTQSRMLDQLIGVDGEKVKLPPDVATVSTGGKATADANAVFSASSALLTSQLAESCDAKDKARATRLASVLTNSLAAQSASRLGLDGTPAANSKNSATGSIAAAGAVSARGDKDNALRLLNQAEQFDKSEPSFEGAQAVALGRVMLTTTWLGTCS